MLRFATIILPHRYDLIELARGHGAYGGNVGDMWDIVDEHGTVTSNACFASEWWVNKLIIMIIILLALATGLMSYL